MGSILECPKCRGPRPAMTAFCPHCGGRATSFKRWLVKALGIAAIGATAACCPSAVDETPGDAGQVRCFRDAGPILALYGAMPFADDGGCG